MDEGAQGVPQELLDEAFRFVEGVLPPHDAHVFGETLKFDPKARAALIEALTVQSMVEIASERLVAPADECADVRARVGPYLDARLPADEKAILSNHTARCEACDLFVSAFAQARRQAGRARTRQRVLLAALVVALPLIGALAVATFDSDGADQSAGAITTTMPPTPAHPPPPIPLESDALHALRSKVSLRAVEGERSPVGEAVAYVRDLSPDLFDEAPTPAVAALLDSVPLSAVDAPLHDEVRLLCACLVEGRLPTSLRGRALQLLARVPGVSVAPSLQVMEQLDDPWMFRSAAASLRGRELSEATAARLRRIIPEAMKRASASEGKARRKWFQGIGDTAKVMSRNRRHDLGAALLSGDYGCDLPERTCRAIAEEMLGNGGRADLIAVAAATVFPAGRDAARHALAR